MKTEFSDHKLFVLEALHRGLQIFTYPPSHEGMHEDDMLEPTVVGIRQINPKPDYPGDKYIDIAFGMGYLICVRENEWIFEGVLFDTDAEFADWYEEQMLKDLDEQIQLINKSIGPDDSNKG
jgi:hypothetical protein